MGFVPPTPVMVQPTSESEMRLMIQAVWQLLMIQAVLQLLMYQALWQLNFQNKVTHYAFVLQHLVARGWYGSD